MVVQDCRAITNRDKEQEQEQEQVEVLHDV